MAEDLKYGDYHEVKVLLRKDAVPLNDKQKVSRTSLQAKEFKKSHNKKDVEALFRVINNDAFKDLCEFLWIDDIAKEKGRRYKHFAGDFCEFVEVLKNIK